MSDTSDTTALERVRIVFGKGRAAKYVSHLALMRVWERMIRRARVPIAYTQGFNPRPKLTFASALPVGATGRAEVIDIELREPMEPDEVLIRLRKQAPAGLEMHRATEVPLREPALQAQVRFSVYEATLAPALPPDKIRTGLANLLSADHLERQREVKDRVREYDLRPLIHDLWYVTQSGDGHVVGMVLVTDNSAAGRPDEVLAELEWSEFVQSVDRVRPVFASEVDELAQIRAAVATAGESESDVGR